MGTSDVPEITEGWYRERGIVNCPMRDEPLPGKVSMSPRPHQPSMSRTYALPRDLRARSPCNLSGLVVPSSRSATPSLGRLQRNLTRSGHLHEPRLTTVHSALLVALRPSLLLTPGSCHEVYWTTRTVIKDTEIAIGSEMVGTIRIQ